MHFDDGEIKPAVGFYYGDPLAGGRILFGGNIQGRYNPKLKSSLRFGDSPENNPNLFTADFDNHGDQPHPRDGFDYATNASWAIDGEATDLELSGHFTHNDRTETERSFEYDSPSALTGTVGRAVPGNLLTDNRNINSIRQENWSLSAKLEQEWNAGEPACAPLSRGSTTTSSRRRTRSTLTARCRA